MDRVALVDDKFAALPTVRFARGETNNYHSSYATYTHLLPEAIEVHPRFQQEHGWPDLEEINDCDLIIYHTWPGAMSPDHAREPLREVLARFRKPVLISFEAGDYEPFVRDAANLVYGLNRAIEQPHVVGVMLQVPYHYKVLKRMISRTVFVPPPTILHRMKDVYRGYREGLLVPRNILGSLGGGEHHTRNGHLSAMVASDAGKRHRHPTSSLIGATDYEFVTEHASVTLTDSELADEFGVTNYTSRGILGWEDYISAIASAKVVVNLDTAGSWGRISLEAALMGTAVLASNQLFPALCLPQTNVDPFDVRGAGVILDRLLTDSGFYEEVVEQGRRRIIKLCDVGNVADRIIRYVRKAGL